MKLLFISFLFLFTSKPAVAQRFYADSLLRELAHAKDDTTRVLLLGALSFYSNTNPDSGFYYARKALRLSQQINYPYGKALSLFYISNVFYYEGNWLRSLETALESLKVAEKLKYKRAWMLSRIYALTGELHSYIGNIPRAYAHYHQALDLRKKSGAPEADFVLIYIFLGTAHLQLNRLDSAFYYSTKASAAFLRSQQFARFATLGFILRGKIYDRLDSNQRAEQFYRLAIQSSGKYGTIGKEVDAYYLLARLFRETNRLDSCIYYAQEALQISKKLKRATTELNACTILTEVYEFQNKRDSTLKYMKMMLAAKDRVYNQERVQQFQLTTFEEERRQKALEEANKQFRTQLKIYALLLITGVFLFVAFMLYRSNKQKRKANALLHQKNAEIQNTLTELKATQAQLIQQEKMASLGELTAGIAHEIQNPLNFVNNFSEVNRELIADMKHELRSGNAEEAIALAEDIEANEQKVNYHGKRADAIVKSMLEHARTAKSEKQPTDINVLAEEYLRLSYHAFKSKDKSFNAILETHFDGSIGKANLAPQDIGRVLLNLFNNAFYAVNEKKKKADTAFEPTVQVTTKQLNGKVEIAVRDNGEGIPEKVLDKIYQPFFTTKPTGEGTGLGLSLSYDIVKAHGGELTAETKEGEGAVFIIWLPLIST